MELARQFNAIRARTEAICKPLQTEDYVVQPIVDVSPPKWHLGHTTWFFETFLLKPHLSDYEEFDPNYNFVFNSYYETVGNRVIRTNRGNLSRPTVNDIYKYRTHVDKAVDSMLQQEIPGDIMDILILGLNHEEQHQELLCTDIKYILGHNPLFPPYLTPDKNKELDITNEQSRWIKVPAGIYDMGYAGNAFCFDNELGRHKVYLHDFEIASQLVTNTEYLAFITNGGYTQHQWWHSEGWDWVKTNQIAAPMYWHEVDGIWHHYTLYGLQVIMMSAPVNHISFYEAAAFAAWKGMRLATEFEWEAAAQQLDWGERWEWTNSAYLQYPGYKKAGGAIGEYNGKFMVNQMVLRGASEMTPPAHSRPSYRNFFHPHLRWQYTGIRLVK